MLSRSTAAAASAAAALVFLAAGFAGLPLVPAVTVRETRSGRLAAVFPARRGDGVTIVYRHSVNKGESSDHLRILPDGAFLLERSVFESFGAGMSDGFEPGVTMRMTDAGVEITGLQRRFDVVNLAVGTVANHRLTVGGSTAALAAVVAPGTLVRIAYERVAPLDAIRKRIGAVPQ